VWRCARRAYIASERFSLPEKDCLSFVVVRASALIVPETAVSSRSQPCLQGLPMSSSIRARLSAGQCEKELWVDKIKRSE
jgi:hypothetical protein